MKSALKKISIVFVVLCSFQSASAQQPDANTQQAPAQPTAPAPQPTQQPAQPTQPAQQPTTPTLPPVGISSGQDVPGTSRPNPEVLPQGTTEAAQATEVSPSVPQQPVQTGAPVVTAPAAATATTATVPTEATAILAPVPPQVWVAAQEIDYRQIPNILWPSPFLAASAIRETHKDVWMARDVEKFKEIFNEYCVNYARLYQAEIENQWQIPKGVLQFGRICDSLQPVIKNATAQDTYLFEYPNPLVIRKMDQAAYQIYMSPALALNKQQSKAAEMAPDTEPVIVAPVPEESASLFAGLGIPTGLVPLVSELLLLLSLMLNFFLLYKVLKK